MPPSARAADLLSLLPAGAGSRVAVAGCPRWPPALDLLGRAAGDAASADAWVCDEAALTSVLAREPGCVLLLGSAPALLRSRGWQFQRYLVHPSVAEPRLAVPLGQPGAARYALRCLAPPPTRVKQARNRGLEWLLATGRLPRRLPVVTVAVPGPLAMPALVELARSLTGERVGGWTLSFPGNDDLSRLIAAVLPPDTDRPAYVVKAARTAAGLSAMAGDARGLALLDGCERQVRRHAPTLIGGAEQGGQPTSVETAGPGPTLGYRLLRWPGRPGTLRLLDDISTWVIELGLGTRRSATSTTSATVAGSPTPTPMPTVTAHNDLGCWNILSDGSDFTVVDWESATAGSPPLWDLVYFLTDAAGQLAGARETSERVRAATALHRGELPTSAWVSGWLRRAAGLFGLSPLQLGPLVYSCWTHHEGSYRRRVEAAARAGLAPPAAPAPAELLAAAWRDDPLLRDGSSYRG